MAPPPACQLACSRTQQLEHKILDLFTEHRFPSAHPTQPEPDASLEYLTFSENLAFSEIALNLKARYLAPSQLPTSTQESRLLVARSCARRQKVLAVGALLPEALEALQQFLHQRTRNITSEELLLRLRPSRSSALSLSKPCFIAAALISVKAVPSRCPAFSPPPAFSPHPAFSSTPCLLAEALPAGPLEVPDVAEDTGCC